MQAVCNGLDTEVIIDKKLAGLASACSAVVVGPLERCAVPLLVISKEFFRNLVKRINSTC